MLRFLKKHRATLVALALVAGFVFVVVRDIRVARAGAAVTPTRHAAHSANKAGPPVLDNFSFQCNDSDANGLMSMHQGVIKVCIPLANYGAGLYGPKYGKYGFPVKITLYLPAGAKFSAKVKIHGWNKLYPKKTKPTKADKSWRWAKVGGVMRPRWFVKHLLPSTLAASIATIQLPDNPSVAKIVMTAIFPHVKGRFGVAPKQLSCGTFYDSSSGVPPPQNQCNY